MMVRETIAVYRGKRIETRKKSKYEEQLLKGTDVAVYKIL
jgi:hypothetical protein